MSIPTARILPFRTAPPRVLPRAPVPPTAAASSGAAPPVWLQVVFVTAEDEEDTAHWRRRVSAFLCRLGLVARFDGGALGIASIGPVGTAPEPQVRRHVLSWLLSQPEVVLLRERTSWPMTGRGMRIDESPESEVAHDQAG